jgi:hypothetical protein
MAKEKSVSTNNSETNIQVLKNASCPTTSGKSTLGYQVGCDETGAIYLKVASNDGGGFFSDEWISFVNIKAALDNWPEDQGVTSMAFRKIFRSKSANQPGFTLAILVAEGLLRRMADRKRVHEVCDPDEFLSRVETLRKGTVTKAKPKANAPKATAKAPRKPTAKTPRKSPATSRKGK